MMEQFEKQKALENPKPKDEDKLFTEHFMLCDNCKTHLDYEETEQPPMITKAEVDKLIAAGKYPKISTLMCLPCETLCCR
jgi:hypothetical protein